MIELLIILSVSIVFWWLFFGIVYFVFVFVKYNLGHIAYRVLPVETYYEPSFKIVEKPSNKKKNNHLFNDPFDDYNPSSINYLFRDD